MSIQALKTLDVPQPLIADDQSFVIRAITVENADPYIGPITALVESNLDWLRGCLLWAHDPRATSPASVTAYVESCAIDHLLGRGYHLLFGLLHIAADQTERLVGLISLEDIRLGHRAELGFWVDQQWASCAELERMLRQFITHIFTHMAIDRLEIACVPTYVRCVELAHRLGFNFEARRNLWRKVEGHYYDVDVYVLIRPGIESEPIGPEYDVLPDFKVPPR